MNCFAPNICTWQVVLPRIGRTLVSSLVFVQRRLFRRAGASGAGAIVANVSRRRKGGRELP